MDETILDIFWERYKAKRAPRGASPEQLQDIRHAFYWGMGTAADFLRWADQPLEAITTLNYALNARLNTPEFLEVE